jgi:hypothetical protein
MAGTYNYMKVAKMVMDASSVMFIDSSNAVLKSTSLTATRLVTKTLNWDNAYNPTPNNNTPLYSEILDTPNVSFNRLSVQGTSTLSGPATFGSLATNPVVTGSLSATSGTVGSLTSATADIGSLDVSGNVVLTGTNSAGSVVTSSLVTNTLGFRTLSTACGVNIDTSGDFLIPNKLNVNGSVSLLDSLYINSNLAVKQNVSLTDNICILENKYIGNIVSVGGKDGLGVFQMWDGSGYSDPSGFIVSLTSTQLQTLLNLLI